jgi:hypothetical protein
MGCPVFSDPDDMRTFLALANPAILLRFFNSLGVSGKRPRWSFSADRAEVKLPHNSIRNSLFAESGLLRRTG